MINDRMIIRTIPTDCDVDEDVLLRPCQGAAVELTLCMESAFVVISQPNRLISWRPYWRW